MLEKEESAAIFDFTIGLDPDNKYSAIITKKGLHIYRMKFYVNKDPRKGDEPTFITNDASIFFHHMEHMERQAHKALEENS